MVTPVLQFFKKPVFKDFRFIFLVFFLATLVVAIQRTFFLESNNYKIFYNSLKHLREGTSLYSAYPEYFDFYLYSPSFAAFFSPFFLLPYKAGLFLWYFFFSAVWVYAIYNLPIDDNKKVFAYWFGLQELLTALGNTQTNPLMAAVPLLVYAAFEKKQPFWAAFFMIVGFNIKVYSLVAGALFLLYPQKLKFILSCLFWGVVFALLPLLYTPFSKLMLQYQWWWERLQAKTDQAKTINVSIHRILDQSLGSIPPLWIIGVGVVLFCSVYIHVKSFKKPVFKLLFLASILIFQVVFNPASESATYITAVTGVILWWLFGPKKTVDLILVIACFILTVLSPSDLMPAVIKEEFIRPYVLKAWPCILIWFRIIYLLHKTGFENLQGRDHDNAKKYGQASIT